MEVLQAMPPALIAQQREALRRARARVRYEQMQDQLMAGGVEWGKGYTGQLPQNTLPYKENDNPARAHLNSLYTQSLGDQPPSRQEREETHRELLKSIFSD